MAKMRNWMKRPDLVRQLHELEVPVDLAPDDLLHDEKTSAKLRIYPIGGITETSAFDLSLGGAGYMVSLSLTVLRTPFSIAAFELSLPWPVKYMIWLAYPADGNGPRISYRRQLRI